MGYRVAVYTYGKVARCSSNVVFRPEYGKRQQVYDSADMTTTVIHVANEHITRECDDLLPPDGPTSGVHVAWKVSQPAICGSAYAVHSSWTEH